MVEQLRARAFKSSGGSIRQSSAGGRATITWGPAFDTQKRFFTGRDDLVSRPPYLLHYDVEVSGFGSHQSGHLVLLRLKEQIYPGGASYEHWPTLGMNTLRWAKRQGAVCGPAHSGFGLEVNSADLPNYIVPPFNGIGANEYIVDVTHEVPGPDGKHVRAAALLPEKPNPERGKRRYQEQPYWDIERARIGDRREVAVELVVNGYPVAKQNLVADGSLRDLTFD